MAGASFSSDERMEIELLRATLVELREALPQCGRSGCTRVVTFDHPYDIGACDEHRHLMDSSAIEHPWAAVSRRLGW